MIANNTRRIGEIITQERNKQGMSIYHMCKISGLSYSTVYGIESGHTVNPSFDIVISLARALDVPVSNFYIERRVTNENSQNAAN